MIRVAIFIPVSRADHLERLFHSLEVLQCDKDRTALLTYVDGDSKLFVQTRNLTELSKFGERLCVQRSYEGRGQHRPAVSVRERRNRIAAIHNEAKEFIPECEYVFGIEDDTIVPAHALTRLLSGYAAHPYAGFVEGVELGRWGIPYVGAWRADDIYDLKRIETVMPPEERKLEAIDAGGFYCYLTRRQQYMAHEYAPFQADSLGPDVNYGLWLRQQGFQNYIDWNVLCEHRRRNGDSVTLATSKVRQVIMELNRDRWRQQIA